VAMGLYSAENGDKLNVSVSGRDKRKFCAHRIRRTAKKKVQGGLPVLASIRTRHFQQYLLQRKRSSHLQTQTMRFIANNIYPLIVSEASRFPLVNCLSRSLSFKLSRMAWTNSRQNNLLASSITISKGSTWTLLWHRALKHTQRRPY